MYLRNNGHLSSKERGETMEERLEKLAKALQIHLEERRERTLIETVERFKDFYETATGKPCNVKFPE